MKAIQALLAAAATLFAAVPGLNAILKGAGATPGDDELFGGISLATGCLVLLLGFLYRKDIQAWSRRRVIRATVVLVVAALISFASHQTVLNDIVVAYVRDTPAASEPTLFTFPLFPAGKLKTMVEAHGGKRAAVYAYGPDAIWKTLGEQPNPLLIAVTKGILLLTFSTIGAALALAFLIVASRLTKTPAHKKNVDVIRGSRHSAA